ncbi:putative reverse transcriptase domain-containing protein, partial [Tanacetum coccineum]
WIELFSDYDCEIRYHSGKVNVVADTFSRKERVKPRQVRAMSMTIRSNVTDKILAAQGEESKDGIPLIGDVRTIIMDETHASRYLVHPGADKTYYDLGDMRWWPCMKKDVATYVSNCLNCSKVKLKHKRPSGLFQQHEIPEWKWDRNTMDFITKFPRSSSGHDTIWYQGMEFLSIISDYDGRATSRFFADVAKALETRLDISTAYHPQTDGQVVLIKEKLKAARDRQKSYADNRRKLLEFEVGDRVLLKVSPWKGVIRFGKKGKLALRYVGPFEILKRIGPVAYRLRLPDELSSVHDTFYVLNLKKCLADANLHVPLDEIKIDKTFRFVEEPVIIMDREVKS